MRLTEVASSADIAVLRDGDFLNLGFLNDRHESQFVFLESRQFLAALLRCENIRAVLTSPELAKQIPAPLALATCSQPRLAFAAIHNHLARTGVLLGRIRNGHHPGAGYDIVFAKARAALEALAVGAAVVLSNPRGLGPLVSTQKLRRPAAA